jgi:hypothetical protein
LNNNIDCNGFLISAPKLTYSIKGQKLDDNTFSVNYEGTTGEILVANGLTYNPFTKKVVKTNTLRNNNISQNNMVLGFMTCDNVIKRFSGVYNLKQNTTEILSYETY